MKSSIFTESAKLVSKLQSMSVVCCVCQFLLFLKKRRITLIYNWLKSNRSIEKGSLGKNLEITLLSDFAILAQKW